MSVKLAGYNRWANEIICGYILNAGEEAADKHIESSFTGIRKTLIHIWDAQVIWQARINGFSPTEWPGKNFKGSLEEACTGMINNSEDFVALARNNENNFEKIITYHALNGKQYTDTISDIIIHCVNHGTYHRGQLITMLRQAGFTDVGSTDFIRYCRINTLHPEG